MLHQLFVAASLDNPPLIEHHDLIGVPDRGQTMGDGYQRAVSEKCCEAALDRQFRLGVQCTGRFVQNKDG